MTLLCANKSTIDHSTMQSITFCGWQLEKDFVGHEVITKQKSRKYTSTSQHMPLSSLSFTLREHCTNILLIISIFKITVCNSSSKISCVPSHSLAQLILERVVRPTIEVIK